MTPKRPHVTVVTVQTDDGSFDRADCLGSADQDALLGFMQTACAPCEMYTPWSMALSRAGVLESLHPGEGTEWLLLIFGEHKREVQVTVTAKRLANDFNQLGIPW